VLQYKTFTFLISVLTFSSTNAKFNLRFMKIVTLKAYLHITSWDSTIWIANITIFTDSQEAAMKAIESKIVKSEIVKKCHWAPQGHSVQKIAIINWNDILDRCSVRVFKLVSMCWADVWDIRYHQKTKSKVEHTNWASYFNCVPIIFNRFKSINYFTIIKKTLQLESTVPTV